MNIIKYKSNFPCAQLIDKIGDCIKLCVIRMRYQELGKYNDENVSNITLFVVT